MQIFKGLSVKIQKIRPGVIPVFSYGQQPWQEEKMEFVNIAQKCHWKDL